MRFPLELILALFGAGGRGGVKLWKDQSFCLGGGGEGGGFGVSIPPWSGQSCVRKG